MCVHLSAHIKVALKWHNQTCLFRSFRIRNSTWKTYQFVVRNKISKNLSFSRSAFKPIELYISDVCYWSYFSKKKPQLKEIDVSHTISTWQITKTYTHTVHTKKLKRDKAHITWRRIFFYQNAEAMVSMKTDDICYGLFLCMRVAGIRSQNLLVIIFLFFFSLTGCKNIIHIPEWGILTHTHTQQKQASKIKHKILSRKIIFRCRRLLFIFVLLNAPIK